MPCHVTKQPHSSKLCKTSQQHQATKTHIIGSAGSVCKTARALMPACQVFDQPTSLLNNNHTASTSSAFSGLPGVQPFSCTAPLPASLKNNTVKQHRCKGHCCVRLGSVRQHVCDAMLPPTLGSRTSTDTALEGTVSAITTTLQAAKVAQCCRMNNPSPPTQRSAARVLQGYNQVQGHPRGQCKKGCTSLRTQCTVLLHGDKQLEAAVPTSLVGCVLVSWGQTTLHK